MQVQIKQQLRRGPGDSDSDRQDQRVGLRPSASILSENSGFARDRRLSVGPAQDLLHWERLITVVGWSGGQLMQLLTASANAKSPSVHAYGFVDTTPHGP